MPLGTPFDPSCGKCQGRGYLVVEYPTHTDLEPCQCAGEVNQCAKGHAAILFSGASYPLCAVLKKIEAAPATAP